MSFKCQVCDKPQSYAPHRRVLQTRLVKYDTQFFNDKGYRVNNVNSTGHEIAKEVMVCTDCAKTISPTAETDGESKVVKGTAIKKRPPRDMKSRDRK